MGSKSEAHNLLVKRVIVALSKTGICRVWEQMTGAAYRGDLLIRYGLVGCADITGILNGGIRLEIEIKTGKAVQSPQQLVFERMIRKFDGIYIVVHSVEEAVTLVTKEYELRKVS